MYISGFGCVLFVRVYEVIQDIPYLASHTRCCHWEGVVCWSSSLRGPAYHSAVGSPASETVEIET